MKMQNFIVCVLDAQYKHKNSETFDSMVLLINYVFSAIFAVELAINLFANWLDTFVRNGWNWLDVFIVLMSLFDFGPLSVPDWMVRLMRAVRVVRLFGRVRQLTKMISAITASLFPMMNAFVILIVVLSICALASPRPTPAPTPRCHAASLLPLSSGLPWQSVCPFRLSRVCLWIITSSR